MDFGCFCDEITGLIDLGLCRAWGVTNWSAPQIRAAQGLITDPLRRPRLVQMQYNVCRRAMVESDEFTWLFAETEIRLFPAFVLEGGILTGHLERDRVQPSEFARGKVPRERNIARDAGGIRDLVRQRHADLVRIAGELRITPAQAAIAFCLSHPATASALVGVTRIADLHENLQSLSVEADAHTLRRALEPLSVAAVQAPKLFNPYNDE
jgi:aryl-alcohol dehydrogenase-like predicted oxidoreductase